MEKYNELIKLAEAARENAYCPYSHISVGAALLSKSGKIYIGANCENAAYSPSICAERAAFASATSQGERDFFAIAVRGGKENEVSEKEFVPCGVCLQVMSEFCSADFKIILGEDKIFTLSELLPNGFNLDF